MRLYISADGGNVYLAAWTALQRFDFPFDVAYAASISDAPSTRDEFNSWYWWLGSWWYWWFTD